MTPYIPDLKNETNITTYQHRKSGQNEDYNAFCEHRNKPQREIWESRTEYFLNKIDEDKCYPKFKKTIESHQIHWQET